MTDQTNQLILHRVGDENGTFTVINEKCLLRSRLDGRMVDSCAIFVGPQGTALRSYAENVRVNGEVATAQWLNVGDQIKLPCDTTLEVRSATKCDVACTSALTTFEFEPSVDAVNEVDSTDAVSVQSAPAVEIVPVDETCLLYTSPSPRDATLSRMPSSA